MTKKPGKRRTRGMLTTMVKYPKGPQHKPKRTLLRTIGLWTAGIVLGGALLVMFVGLLVMIFNPEVGRRDREGEFQVDSITEGPPGYTPERKIVAAAVLEIEKRWTQIPLTAETRKGVEKGATLHVRYDYVPRMGIVRVTDWRLLKEAPAPE